MMPTGPIATATTVVDLVQAHGFAAIRDMFAPNLRADAAAHPARCSWPASLGGTVAPRVAVAEPAVAGLVILAGGAQPLHWSAVRQFRYLGSLNLDTAAASRSIIDTVTRQAETVDSPDLSPATPAGDLPFGVPASYWLDRRHHRLDHR